ncbi:MAG: pilin, partial [Patescibacteria group bacterium]
MLPWIRKNFRDLTVASIILAAAVFVFLPMLSAGAQGDTFGLQEIDQNVELANQDFRVIASKIIRAVLGLLGIIALALVLYAGYTITTSAGNEEKITQGKNILKNAVIGLVIIMSAFTIVQFVINALTDATGLGGSDDGGVNKPKFSTFTGSGGLGSIIKDHYPMRGQTAVPRNTKIAITFFDPIDPASLIVDTNKSCWDLDGLPTVSTVSSDPSLCKTYPENIPAKGIVKGDPKIYYGDCLDLDGDGKINSAIECDHLNTASLKIYKSADKNLQPPVLYEATAMAAYEKEISSGLEKAYTFVFKPEEFLGDDAENVWHTIYLIGNDSPSIGVKKADGTDLFLGQFSSHYEWEFETNTIIDFSAPHVVVTYPAAGAVIKKNSVVQVYYNEAIDPIVAQGAIGGTGDDYENAIFSNPDETDKVSDVAGRWNITNGYTTMEF